MFSTISGVIDRRLLVNFAADPRVVQKILPAPFRPQLVNGKAVVGVCLIRFSGLKPKGFPFGISSENAAHRIAVEWEGSQGTESGVYIVRRDTNSYLKHWLGGRLFSGVHHLATFETCDNSPHYEVNFKSVDHSVQVQVSGAVVDGFTGSELFDRLEQASQFFRAGAVGYSPGFDGKAQGMQLVTMDWNVAPFKIEHVQSSYFSDESLFPKESIRYDHTLIMRNLTHQWHTV